MAADKKSSLVQIAQEVLDESSQSIKVSVVSGGGGGASDINIASIEGNNVSLNTGVADAGTQRVVLASDQPTVSVSLQTLNSNNLLRNSYAITSVTTSAYTQLIASVTSTVKEIEIFDSSGESLVLALGAAGSEVNKIYVFPGGNGRIPIQIAIGQRLSIKAISANATSGELLINFYG